MNAKASGDDQFTKVKKQNILGDSLLLSIVQVVTIVAGMAQTMVLARTLTKEVYGTFSQTLLVYSFITPLVSLGLGGSINYFFNKTDNQIDRLKAINTIFFLTTVTGIVGAVMMIGARSPIAGYFSNPELIPLILYISIRPLLTNLIALYQPLYISLGFTKIIAIRNLLVSVFQVLFILIVSLYIKSLVALLLIFLFLDTLQLIIFSQFLNRKYSPINIFNGDRTLLKPILQFSLPMLLSTLLGTISINFDKLLIGRMMSTEDFALYSNMAKELPLSFIVASITTVITPHIIKYIHKGENNKFKELWSDYLEIGYSITWTLIIGLFVVSSEVITILYSTKYLDPDGLIVFKLYLIVAAFRFTYFGMVPSAMGKTKVILLYTVIAIVVNIVLNYPFFLLFGMTGPAIATIISMFISAVLYFVHSLKLVNLRFGGVVRVRYLSGLVIIFGIGILLQVVGYNILKTYTSNNLLLFSVIYLLFIGFVALCKTRYIINMFHKFKSYS